MENSSLPDILEQNFSKKFLSFCLPAKNIERLKPLLDHLQESCFDARNFEVNIAIDEGNNECENELKKIIPHYGFEIKFCKTNYGYFRGNSNYNHLIFNCSDQTTYFVSCISDRYRFATKNWDLLIKAYIGTLPDDMFFLRMANYSKNIKTRRNLYRAFTANENWGIYSRKLLNIVGGFPELLVAHDFGFEMLYFFMRHNKKDPLRRDITTPNALSTDAIIGSTAQGLEAFYRRSLKGFLMIRRSFFRKEVAEILKSDALKVYLHYLLWKRKINGVVIKDEKKKICFIQTSTGKKIKKNSYRVSPLFALKQNLIARYRSVHFEIFIIAFYPLLRTKWGYNFVLNLIQSQKISAKIILFFLRLFLGCGETNFANHLNSQEMRNVLQSQEFAADYDNNFGKKFWKEFKKN